jgi:hypothetical protein
LNQKHGIGRVLTDFLYKLPRPKIS